MSEPSWELLGGGGTVGGPIDYIGPWSASVTYQPGQIVRYNGVDYLACNPSLGQTPPVMVPLTTNYGTVLPASPIDGQEYVLVDSTTNPTYQWRFRYNAGNSSAYKWEFVGGPPLQPASGGSITLATSQTTPIDVTGGPTLTVPRSGVYRYIFGGLLYNGGTFVSAYSTNIQVYAGATALGLPAQLAYHSGQYGGAAISTDGEATLSAGAVLNFKAWVDRVSNNSVISLCWIQLTPVRVA